METNKYIKLTFEERQKIEKMLKDKIPVSRIANFLKRSVLTIDAEIKKNGNIHNYNAEAAQINKESTKIDKLTNDEKEIIKKMRKEGISFREIAYKLNRNYNSIRSCCLKFEDENTNELKFDFEKQEKEIDDEIINNIEDEIEEDRIDENQETFHQNKTKDKKGRHLSLEDRKEIQRLYEEGESLSNISRILGFGKNTIIVEFRRNSENGKYCAKTAHKKSAERRKDKYKNVSESLKKSEFSPWKALNNKIKSLEMHVEILFDEIKKLKG